jgi:hypothetical protein
MTEVDYDEVFAMVGPVVSPVDLVDHDAERKRAIFLRQRYLEKENTVLSYIRDGVELEGSTIDEKYDFILQCLDFDAQLEKEEREKKEIQPVRPVQRSSRVSKPDYVAPFDKRQHKQEQLLDMDFGTEEPVCKTDQTKVSYGPAGRAQVAHWKTLPRVVPTPVPTPVVVPIATPVPTPTPVSTPVPTPVVVTDEWTVQVPLKREKREPAQRYVFQQCKYGMKCRNQECGRAHKIKELNPAQCRFGAGCSMKQPDGSCCSRIHPNEDIRSYARRLRMRFE